MLDKILIKKHKGITIISAMFITTVMTLAAYFIVNISIENNASTNILIQGTRAFYAAKSGVEWGLTNATINNACVRPTIINIEQSGLKGFSVYVTCRSLGTGRYSISATATITNKNLGEFGYVTRTLTESN